MAEKIGEGLQYTVFDLGSGRVRKEPKSREEMIEMAMNWHDSRQKAIRNVDLALGRREKVEEKLQDKDIPGYIFGNFERDGSVVYQDKLVPVDQKLEKADSLELKKKIIDDYVALLQVLWSYGVGDTIYNFTINNGYDDKGRLVQMDFGELVFSKERIREEVRDQKWLDKRSYEHDLPEKLKLYFKKRMAEEITVEKLEDKWRENM